MNMGFIAEDARDDTAEELVLAARNARLWAAAAEEVAAFYESHAVAALRRTGASKHGARRTLRSKNGSMSVLDEDVWTRVGYLNVLVDPEEEPLFTPFADARRNAVVA